VDVSPILLNAGISMILLSDARARVTGSSTYG
jgi:hypothetical protein